MPRNTDGSWSPPPAYASWDVWAPEFVKLAPAESQDDAWRLLRACMRAKENPGTFARRWGDECGKWPKFGRNPMPSNWPAFLTAGDWRSLAMFAENETKPKPVEV